MLQTNYCAHRTQPSDTNQNSAALSHAPFQAISESDPTWQLGCSDSAGPPTSLQCAAHHCVCVWVCVYFSKTMRNRSHLVQCGRKFPTVFFLHVSTYTKHLLNWGFASDDRAVVWRVIYVFLTKSSSWKWLVPTSVQVSFSFFFFFIYMSLIQYTCCCWWWLKCLLPNHSWETVRLTVVKPQMSAALN